MDLQKTFAKNFRVMLGERQIKKSDIHRKTGIARSTLYHISKGEMKGIQFETIEQIAKVLDIEPYELFK